MGEIVAEMEERLTCGSLSHVEPLISHIMTVLAAAKIYFVACCICVLDVGIGDF